MGGTVPFFLDETNVVLLLEFKHLVLAIAQIFLHLDELLGNRGGDVVPLVFTHPFFEIEILLHDRIQVGLGVIGRAADRLQIENGSARLLHHGDFHEHGLQLGMQGAHERFRPPPDFGALHELSLRAVEVDAVFAVNRVLADVQLAREHHFARGRKRRRCLIGKPGLNEKPKANGQEQNPPPAEQETFVAMNSGDE